MFSRFFFVYLNNNNQTILYFQNTMGERVKNVVSIPTWLMRSFTGVMGAGLIGLVSLTLSASSRANEAISGVETNREFIETKADHDIMDRNYDAIKGNTKSINELGKKIDRLIEGR